MKRFLVFLFLLSFIVSTNAKEKAKWITAFENQNATNSWLCFRKNFEVNNLPSKAITQIAADSKYWLWINGQLVVIEGGVKRGVNPEDTYYDEIDIAPFLKKGNNNISILVWYFGKQGFSYNPSGIAALLFICNTKEFELYSDSSWKSVMHPAYYTPSPPYPNFRLPESSIGFDARSDMEGWEQNNFNDMALWPNAKVVGQKGDAPWNKLHHRIIPMWKDFGLKNYVNQVLHPGSEFDTLACQLPYNAQIMPYLEINAPAGKMITMQTSHYKEGGVYNVRAEYITKQGKQSFENKGWMNGEVMYYIYPKGIKLEKVQFRETGYNTEFEGYFKCEDDFLNRMWNKSQRTLYLTMRDTYMDCPDRERAQWWGDEVIEAGEAFYALSPSSHLLMKKGMYELIGWQRATGEIFSPIPSSNYHTELPGQMLASVGYYGFWNYYLNTGDLKTIRDLYPGVRQYMNVWKKNTDGTIKFRAGEWTWGDWGTNIDFHVLFNAWYYIALRGQLLMAKELGLKEDELAITSEMKDLKFAFNKAFWNGKEYRAKDYKLLTDDRVNALAVLGGLADKSQYPAILKVLQINEHASPYMEKYVIEALFQMGYSNYGMERMKRRFSQMVNDPQRSTLFEFWDSSIGGTTNHAWSGGGLTILSQYVCGVFPSKPGYEDISITPHPTNISKAETLVPSVKGNIKVAFENKKKQYILNVTIPDKVKALIEIPVKAKSLQINGVLVWKAGDLDIKTEGVTFNKKSNKQILSFYIEAKGVWNFIIHTNE